MIDIYMDPWEISFPLISNKQNKSTIFLWNGADSDAA